VFHNHIFVSVMFMASHHLSHVAADSIFESV